MTTQEMTVTSRLMPLAVSFTLAVAAAAVPFQIQAAENIGKAVKLAPAAPSGSCPIGYTKTTKKNGENFSYTCTSEKLTCDKGFNPEGWHVPDTPQKGLTPNNAFAEERPYPFQQYVVISFTCDYIPPNQ